MTEAITESRDRRVARTKAALHNALMSLILRRRYEAITIKDVCEAANVGRSTFYDHYAGKDDLKRDGLEQLRFKLVEHRADRKDAAAFGFSLRMFEHGRDYLNHYRVLVGSRTGKMALDKIRQILFDLVRKELVAGADLPDARREIAVQYVVGAYMSVLTWWLDTGARQPPAEIDAVFRRLVTEGIRPPAGNSKA